jgi:IclR family transcriptional regulator, KDG regulon repressor
MNDPEPNFKHPEDKMKIVKSVFKALSILQLFSDSNGPMSLTEIAKVLKMDDATVSHIISTLVFRGFLKQNSSRGKYCLGDKFLELGSAINRSSSNTYGTMSYITELGRLVNESVHLCLWSNNKTTFFDTSGYYEVFNISPGNWITPLHCTAIGKLILVDMSEESLNQYLHSKPLEKFTAHTIVNIVKLKYQLSMVKRDGVAFEDREYHNDTRGIAVPIKDKSGHMTGIIFVIRPYTRLTDESIKKITPSLKTCARKISLELSDVSQGVMPFIN